MELISHIFTLIFLKRNRFARLNFTPAFRSNAIYMQQVLTHYSSPFKNGITAAIGAISKTSQPRISFPSYTATQLISLCLLLFLVQPAIAQPKKEVQKKIAIATKAKYSKVDNIEQFNFKAKKEATYNVLVLSPSADIVSKPIQNKTLSLGEELIFNINSKYWKPGTYRIFIQIDGVTVEQRKLIIQRQRKKRR